MTRSFRDVPLPLLCQHGTKQSVVEALFVDQHGQESHARVTFDVQSKSKKIEKEKEILSPTEYVWLFPSVTIEPDDMLEFFSAPALRRRALDMLLSQLDSEYLYALQRYNTVVRTRNKLLLHILQEKSSVEELYFWDGEMALYGGLIVWKRQQLLQDIAPLFDAAVQRIAGQDEQVTLVYEPSVKPFVDLIETRSRFAQLLQDRRMTDIQNAQTGMGPHRDDMKILMRGVLAEHVASRGQMRSFALAFRLASLELLKQKHTTVPMVLLDDVFAELDETRFARLIESFDGVQLFLTLADSARAKHLYQQDPDHTLLVSVTDLGVSVVQRPVREQ